MWKLVEANSIAIPYFGGDLIRRPVIKLENIESGREVWFFNTHNPASTPNHGNNARWRGVAVGIEIRLANELAADGTPGRVHRRLQRPRRGVLPDRRRHRHGGRQRRRLLPAAATPPTAWTSTGSSARACEFSDFVSASQGIVGRVSDHPFVYAEAYIPEEPLGGDEGEPRRRRTHPSDGARGRGSAATASELSHRASRRLNPVGGRMTGRVTGP